MTDGPLRCMPPPLSLLCALDDRHHKQRGAATGFVCAVHDRALAAWWRIWWTIHPAKGSHR